MSIGGYNQPQKRRLFRRGVAAGLLLISVLMLLADRQQKEMLASGRLAADDVSAKVMGVLATPIRGIEMVFQSAGDRAAAYQQNKVLKVEVERLRGYENKVLDLELRLKTFENMFNMDEGSSPELERVIARAVSETKGPFAHSALINSGRDEQVKIGSAAMTVDGLYGHVVRVGKSSARVLLLNDLNSHISVRSQRSESRAIMIGSNADMPRLDYVSPESDWRVGDRVVTSGDGGVLPAGLHIGVIEGIENQQFRVRLATHGHPVDWVWVLLFNPIVAPTEPVEVEMDIAAGSMTEGLQ